MPKELARFPVGDGSAYIACTDGKVYRRWPDGMGYVVNTCRTVAEARMKAQELAALQAAARREQA